MKTQIRLATLNDLEIIVAITETQNKKKKYENPEWFYQESIELGRLFVATEDDKICGFLVYQVLWGNSPLLSLVKVREESQRQKIGTALVQNLEKVLRDQSYEQLVSSTELENIESVLFHHSLGFIQSGSMEGITCEEVFYKKKL